MGLTPGDTGQGGATRTSTHSRAVGTRTGPWSIVVGALVLAIAPLDADAQAGAGPAEGALQVEQGELRADPVGPADYAVQVTYTVRGLAGPLAVSMLETDAVRVGAVQVQWDGRSVPLTRRAGGGVRDTDLWVAKVNPAEGRTEPPARTDSVAPATVAIRYQVQSAMDPETLRLTLPVAVISAGPPESVAGAFEVDIGLEAERDVRRAFPTDLRVEGGRASVSLSFVPRFVRAELTPGPVAAWARVSPTEAFATLLILVFGAMGWRHLNRPPSS